jgi:hypothetical protein
LAKFFISYMVRLLLPYHVFADPDKNDDGVNGDNYSNGSIDATVTEKTRRRSPRT